MPKSSEPTGYQRHIKQASISQIIFKWLIIACVVLAILASVLLALGYMLKENERKTRALKAELEQAAQVKQTPLNDVRDSEASIARELTPLSALASGSTLQADQKQAAEKERQVQAKIKQQLAIDIARLQQLDQAKNIILNNLVCQNVNQCHFIDTQSIDLGCVIAVNTIGKSMLSRQEFIQAFSKTDNECEERISELSLTCHHNICSIQ
ncbi:hypothetical protein DXX93_02525 [Thalassotalea euphylliae]|uniref:Uncharacterized protein n=1 Tax=Thalassotalea euphylliae TaxID=1655234 RepID=A0A3E0TMA8_9GAMM|nr:hypothetical protein [Thalassotalea euphylliae]REL25533.1 hypothetical protein DXX93_02525 [Thalassotalea euphylliae]